VLYGRRGIVKICGEKGRAVAVPEGEWKMLACCIEPADPAATQPVAVVTEQAGDAAAIAPAAEAAKEVGRDQNDSPQDKPTRVVARGKAGYKTVRIRANKTAELPFGPPYKPVIQFGRRSGDDGMLRLTFSLVGTGGEVCSDILVNGDRPGEPSFTIATPDGEIVERGKFEYG
jgi:hypothetical protein